MAFKVQYQLNFKTKQGKLFSLKEYALDFYLQKKLPNSYQGNVLLLKLYHPDSTLYVLQPGDQVSFKLGYTYQNNLSEIFCGTLTRLKTYMDEGPQHKDVDTLLELEILESPLLQYSYSSMVLQESSFTLNLKKLLSPLSILLALETQQILPTITQNRSIVQNYLTLFQGLSLLCTEASLDFHLEMNQILYLFPSTPKQSQNKTQTLTSKNGLLRIQEYPDQTLWLQSCFIDSLNLGSILEVQPHPLQASRFVWIQALKIQGNTYSSGIVVSLQGVQCG